MKLSARDASVRWVISHGARSTPTTGPGPMTEIELTGRALPAAARTRAAR